MSAHHRTTPALSRSAKARKLVVLPTECGRCGHTIEIGQPFDMGHERDVAAGGADSPLRPEHRICNRRAGQRTGIAAARARAARPSSPGW